jgi:hypothetical protein
MNMTENNRLNNRFLDEARRIGDRLLAEAEIDDRGMAWKTMTVDDEHHILFTKSESIYTGVSGIVLFFIQLYKQTRDTRYLDAAKEGTKWLTHYCANNPPRNYAFFTGRMGVPYTLVQMHGLTQNEEYLETALTIAGPCKNFLNDPDNVDDLINGRSGTLLGLLHLHAASGAEWLPETIDLFIRHLLDHACHGPQGLYWDRTPYSIMGMCGFSHGAAGIGFVFLELGRYFQNDAFYRAAEQAFLYERYFYEKAGKNRNWPDLRQNRYFDDDPVELEKALRETGPDSFPRGGDINAWCHGAAGIGLSRLRAYRLLKNPFYKDEAQTAVEKTTRTDLENENPPVSVILCHGSGGNAELFLYAYQVLGDKKYLSMAERAAEKILGHHRENGCYRHGYRIWDGREDRGLFMGNAGVGYFLLRLLDPLNVPSILIPALDETSPAGQLHSTYPFAAIPGAGLLKRLLQRYFKRTIRVGGEIIPRQLGAFFNESSSPGGKAGMPLTAPFISMVERALVLLAPGSKEKEILSDVFYLEREKLHMDRAVKNHNYLYIKERVLHHRAGELAEAPDGEFVKLTFCLGPDVRLITTRWQWNLHEPREWTANFEKKGGIWPVLLKTSPMEVKELALSPFSYNILEELREPTPVSHVIRAVVGESGALPPEQVETRTYQVIRQIKEALFAGILGLQP